MLEITRVRLKHTLKNPLLILMMTLLPIVFISFVSAMNFGGPGQAATTGVEVELGFVDLDDTPVSEELAAVLQADERIVLTRFDSEGTAVEELENDTVSAVVLVPDGFSAAAREHRKLEAELIEDTLAATPTVPGQVAEQAFQRFLARVETASMLSGMTQKGSSPLDWQQAYVLTGELWSPRPPLTVVEENYLPAAEAAGEGQEAVELVGPGYIVMFVMMMASIGASSIVTERQLGTLYRLLAAPISRLEILGGHALALGVQGLFQAAVLFGFARFVYGMSLGSSPLALIVIVVSFLVTAVGFGMLLAAFVQTPAQAGAAGSLVIVALSFLGGVWWPVELMPQLMQQVARLSPTYWAGQGLLNVLVRGQGLSSILHYSAYLLLLGAALMLAGSWLLRRKEV